MKPVILSMFPAVLGLVTLAAGCHRPAAVGADKQGRGDATTADRVRVTVDTPHRKDLLLVTTQPAAIEAFESTPLSPKVAGYVARVLVDIGDHVTTGQVLLELDAPEMLDERRQKQALHVQAEAEVGQSRAGVIAAEAGVASAKARVAQAEAQAHRAAAALEQYQSEFARISELAKGQSVTGQLVDESRARLRAAEAGEREVAAGIELARAVQLEAESKVAQAQADQAAAEAREQVAAANLTYVETMLEYLSLKAPYDGVITHRHVDTGHFVRASAESQKPVLAVARIDRVRVFVDVPEAEAARVTSGERADPAVIRVQALSGQEFSAVVTRTSWALDPANRSLRVEVDVDNPEGRLRPGMYATAVIHLEQRPAALTIPATAVIRRDRAAECCVVRDGKVARTPISTGLQVGNDVEVVSGINETDKVVVVRPEALTDGQSVEAVDAGA